MSKKKIVLLIIAIILLIASLTLFLLAYFDGRFNFSQYKNPETSSAIQSTVSSEEIILVDNPINFEELKATNSDIYAWINIPNTKVDYPILQSEVGVDTNFYIDHNINKKYSRAGAIYTQQLNSKDFSDPNTVIYGHNMLNQTMFRTLHNFKNREFFNQNEYIYIYTPGHILTYKIFAAYEYDDRLILTSFNFDDPVEVEKYFQTCLNPTRRIQNVRQGVELNASDKIVTLSTCISKDGARYLVQGVLIDDQLTK